MSKTALLFAGQGAQVAGMGRDFSDQYASARALFEKANAVLGYDLSTICFEGPESELTKTENAQPGIFLVSWVAYQLLRERVSDLEFSATAGLSLGEFTALAAAGVITFEDALAIVRQRGRFMQEACEANPGTMAAVLGLDESSTREVCQEHGVEIANLNCPGQIVISGEKEKIKDACEKAKARGAKRAVELPVAGAYHSRLMATAQPKLGAVLQAVQFHPASVPVISNVTARPHPGLEESKELLVQQVTSSVLWENSIRHLLSEGFDRFIELGPGNALSGFMKRIAKDVAVFNVSDIDSLDSTAHALAR